jgi:hypothetical protein
VFHPRFKPNTNQKALRLKFVKLGRVPKNDLAQWRPTCNRLFLRYNLWVELNIMIRIWILRFHPSCSPCTGLHIGCPLDQCVSSKLVHTTNSSSFVPGVLFVWKARSQGTVSWRGRCFCCTASYVKFWSEWDQTLLCSYCSLPQYVWCGWVRYTSNYRCFVGQHQACKARGLQSCLMWPALALYLWSFTVLYIMFIA